VPIVDGCVEIPERPGLGVELDHDQLARGKERYRWLPYHKRDDEAEMKRRVDPEWRSVIPRW
jgi:glucarate dehydratase